MKTGQKTAWQLKPKPGAEIIEEGYEIMIKIIRNLLKVNYYSRNKTYACSLVCYFANRELGMTTIDISKQLNIYQSAVSRSSYRGEMLANEYDFSLIYN